MRIVIILLGLVHLTAMSQAQPSCISSTCANGSAMQGDFPNGNFEAPPFPPPNGRISFFAGETYSNWQIVSGSIDLLGPNYSNLKLGDPNGPSRFIDLSGFTPGTITTTLTGLTPGYHYAITVWYANNPTGPSASCNIQVAGGAWLNQSWTATNPGNVIWLQTCFSFTAQGTSALVSFIGSSPVANSGMLLDNIELWEQPTFPPAEADAGPDVVVCEGTAVTLTASGGSNYNWNNGENTSSISVSPAVTTTYTVTVSVPNCGTDTDEVTVTVHPLPTVMFTTGDPLLCEGNCKSLQASFTGTPPFTLSYTTGGGPVQNLTFTDNTGNFQVCPPPGTTFGDYVIQAVALTDFFCTCN